MKAVELFVSRGKMESVPRLQDSAKLETVMFVVLLIPGTPKDVLTYAAALAECPWWKVAAIATEGAIVGKSPS